MPPEGEPLSVQEIESLRTWIDEGAAFTGHWAYQSVTEPRLPAMASTDSVGNPIDMYVLAELERHSISPSSPMEPALLVKRLYYDLVGLPAPLESVDAFTRDPSSG